MSQSSVGRRENGLCNDLRLAPGLWETGVALLYFSFSSQLLHGKSAPNSSEVNGHCSQLQLKLATKFKPYIIIIMMLLLLKRFVGGKGPACAGGGLKRTLTRKRKSDQLPVGQGHCSKKFQGRRKPPPPQESYVFTIILAFVAIVRTDHC